jgi:release factor glutamine methyltransferase
MTIKAAQQQLQAGLKLLYPDREAVVICDWVMEHLTGRKKIDRLMLNEQQLTDEQLATFGKMSEELRNGRPVQYVLGEAWFGRNKFFVNEHVLIPRPETEELVNWLAETMAGPTAVKRVLDIGTGSGCIPITLKQLKPQLDIWSIDISPAALAVAQQNAATIGSEVHFIKLNFLDEGTWSQLPQFDLIISNPPYVKHSEQAQMAKHVIDHEPALALFVPDEDALLFYKKIALFGASKLAAGGAIFMEINQELGRDVTELFESAGYNTELRKDLQGNDRMVKAERRDS